MTELHIVICTHNRRRLLDRTIDSLNEAARPENTKVRIVVIANACTDDTTDFLTALNRRTDREESLPLVWTEESKAGKSYALNRALEMIEGGFIAFVDDDHRVDGEYLVALERSVSSQTGTEIFCGRILPDWDGTEPSWAHDIGPYMIYPLPIPRFDLGASACPIGPDSPLPGGGNLVIARSVFHGIGGFSTELGPKGHNLGGSEDTDLLIRARKAGYGIEYHPAIIQYHYVDTERLKLPYLLRKAFQRNRTITLARRSRDKLPPYLFRKLLEYVSSAVFSLGWDRRRFFMVRCAGTLGEIFARAFPRHTRTRIPAATKLLTVLAIGTLVLLAGFPALFIGACVSLVLTAKSLFNFTRSGPQVRDEILENYRNYAIWSVLRLSVFCMLIGALIAAPGVITAKLLLTGPGHSVSTLQTCLAGLLSFGLITAIQFCRQLLYLPSSVCASAQYRLSRMYPLWRCLSPARIALTEISVTAAWATLIGFALFRHVSEGNVTSVLFAISAISAALICGMLLRESDDLSPTPTTSVPAASPSPNIVMIGADTLRVDRLSCQGYEHPLTPFIDSLVGRGTLFTNCYVPLARTAPSLLSLFSGRWPHHHGVRDNFVSDLDTSLQVPLLPDILKGRGYYSHVISDWSGGDFQKFPFDFDAVDVPDDQWNLKYYMRQGPLDLRFFLTLFTHNLLGKAFLPELFYLAGVPLTSHLGRQTRKALSSLSKSDQPFFLNVFMGTTHVPYGSEYPYYVRFSDRDYVGPSKFVMAKFADPMEIIEAQEAERSRFDVDQISNLYDGCVNQFDDEVQRIMTHIDELGVADNTIVVIYSDHGTDFFENHTWGQGNTVVGSDPSAKIPLLIIDPSNRNGAKIDHLVRSVDFVPTILELIGHEPESDLDGVSLAAYCRGDITDLALPAFQETGIWLGRVPGMHKDHIHYPHLLDLLTIEDKDTGTLSIAKQYGDLILRAKDRMVRWDKWKLTYFPLESGTYFQLFDMENDPGCKANVIEKYPEVSEKLKEILMEWITQDPRYLARTKSH